MKKYIGVRKMPSGKFEVRIKHEGKLLHVGTFDLEIDAAIAFDTEAIKLRGSKAIINFKGEHKEIDRISHPDDYRDDENRKIAKLFKSIPKPPPPQRPEKGMTAAQMMAAPQQTPNWDIEVPEIRVKEAMEVFLSVMPKRFRSKTCNAQVVNKLFFNNNATAMQCEQFCYNHGIFSGGYKL